MRTRKNMWVKIKYVNIEKIVGKGKPWGEKHVAKDKNGDKNMWASLNM